MVTNDDVPDVGQRSLQFGASDLEMFQIDEDLHNLTQILRIESLHERLADFFGKELVQRLRSHVS